MKLHLVLLIIVFAVFISCNQSDSSNIVLGKMIFSYDSINSKLLNEEFKYDSLFVNRIGKDSMTITCYLGGKGYYFYTSFSLKNHSFYENRQIPQLIIENETKISIVLIPTFMQRDTIFAYIPKDDFFSVFINDLSFDKCKYQIKKNNDKFITIKQSLTDTTYREIYYYDQYFNIYKYINTWKDNKCVYVRKD
jgi:hypothetical protein